MEQAIESSLAAGLPIVVCVNSNMEDSSHYLLVVGKGYNPSTKATDYYVVDPGYLKGEFPKKSSSAKVYAETLDQARVFMKNVTIGANNPFRYSLKTGTYVTFVKQ